MKVSVLYGTETGNAEMLADDIQSALSGKHEIDCINLADVDPGALSSETFHVIVCSTYGDGELPASAKPFAEELAKTGNGLSGIQFAVFGLGDAEYAETFTHGSLKLADLLKSCGATQVGERMTHDASGDCLPEDVAVPWISEILNQFPLHSKEM